MGLSDDYSMLRMKGVTPLRSLTRRSETDHLSSPDFIMVLREGVPGLHGVRASAISNPLSPQGRSQGHCANLNIALSSLIMSVIVTILERWVCS